MRILRLYSLTIVINPFGHAQDIANPAQPLKNPFELVIQEKLVGDVTSMDFSPDSKLLFTLSADYNVNEVPKIQVWEAPTGRYIKSFPIKPKTEVVKCLTNEYLLLATYDKFSILNLNSGQIHDLSGTYDLYRSSDKEDVFDYAIDGNLLTVFAPLRNQIFKIQYELGLSIKSDRTLFATTNADRVNKIWASSHRIVASADRSVNSGGVSSLHVFNTRGDVISYRDRTNASLFLRDDNLIITGNFLHEESKYLLLSADNLEPNKSKFIPNYPISSSRSGGLLISYEKDRSKRIYDVEHSKFKPRNQIPSTYEGRKGIAVKSEFLIAPNEKFLVVNFSEIRRTVTKYKIESRYDLVFFDIESGKPFEYGQFFFDRASVNRKLDTTFIIGTENGFVNILDLKSMQTTSRKIHDSAITALTNDGNHKFYVGSVKGQMIEWDTENDRVRQFLVPEKYKGLWYGYDSRKPEENRPSAMDGPITNLSLSGSDPKYIVTGSDASMVMWDVESRKVLALPSSTNTKMIGEAIFDIDRRGDSSYDRYGYFSDECNCVIPKVSEEFFDVQGDVVVDDSKENVLITKITESGLYVTGTQIQQVAIGSPYQRNLISLPDQFNVKMNFAPNQAGIVYSLDDGSILTKSFQEGAKSQLLYKQGSRVKDLQVSDSIIYSIALNGTTTFYDFTSRKILSSLVCKEGKWLSYLPNNYYYGAKEIAQWINFRYGLKLYSFDQFDLIYNRPDLVLKNIGLADEVLISSYKNAYIKRLEKMEFSKEKIDQYLNFNPPTEISAPEISLGEDVERYLATNEKSIRIPLHLSDPNGVRLSRLFIDVNDVPLYGMAGKKLTGGKKKVEEEVKVELSPGKNVIRMKVLNNQGIFSLEETVEVNCIASFKKPNLYVITIGASNYQDTSFNLTYAAKDALDLDILFKASTSSNVTMMSIRNEGVLTDNILALKEKLMSSKPQDQVIIFYAGHGLLDEDYNYFLSTFDTDFDNPANQALSYRSLEGLLDGIPARNKLMLIDACHSGEIDKDEIVDNDLSESNGDKNVKKRGFTKLKQKQGVLGLPNSFELMKQLFNDVRSSTGAVVISAASGFEFAYESREWNNGVFTYAVLEGIKNKSADTNQDGAIRVSELKDYVFERVNTLTNGQQNPTSRRENLENDFVIWEY